MDHELELARTELELLKVSAGKAEMAFTIKQRQAEIRRTQENMKVQDNRIEELKVKILELQALVDAQTN